jgi:hypothetical protein
LQFSASFGAYGEPEVFRAISAGEYDGMTTAELLAETGLTMSELRRNARKYGYDTRFGLPPDRADEPSLPPK